LDVVTPPTYEKLEGEMVLSIEFNQLLSVVENISSRMADACLSDKTTMHLIVQYIKDICSVFLMAIFFDAYCIHILKLFRISFERNLMNGFSLFSHQRMQ
jgi:hypothetical protein